ncbi:MAG: hypothetical protein IAE84_00625 [Saprospiraceae bacterium]|nr:hypothetical protein [Saprospiraceae bacterium]
MSNRAMIVVWKWNEGAPAIKGRNIDEWTTENKKDILIRMDIQSKEDHPFIIDTANQHSDKEILLFLHNSAPNHLGNDAREEISEQLQQKGLRFRVVLFSGGRDYIYFTNNPYGLLGIHGNFPVRNKMIDGKVVNTSGLIVNKDQHIISDLHFDSVWNYYWYSRKPILDLAERLAWVCIQNSSQQKATSDVSLKECLNERNVSTDLIAFITTAEDKDYTGSYDMRPYAHYLNAKRKIEIAEKLLHVQGQISKHLEKTYLSAQEANKAVDHIYNLLIELYKALPGDLS